LEKYKIFRQPKREPKPQGVHEKCQNLEKSIGLALQAPKGKPISEEIKMLKSTFFEVWQNPF